MRLRRVLLACLALPLTLWILVPVASTAEPHASLSSIRSSIQSKQGQLNRVHGRQQVLSTDISGLTHRIDGLQSTISTLERREGRIRAQLDAKRAQLERTQNELRVVRARLAVLRARLARGRAVLAQRLVQIYKEGPPDLVTIVLDSHGFADLIEHGAYLQRIGRQDRAIITAVRAAKAATTTAVRRFAALERRQQQITNAIDERRNAVAHVRLAVQGKRDSVDAVRRSKRGLLHRVNQQAGKLDDDIAALQRQQASIEAQLRGSPSLGALPPGPIRGGGRFIWPVNGPITSPFCERRAWEACHPGIDIGVPSGTPIRAAGTGVVAIAGWVSGYGNYTCINHGGGFSTCYGHQSRIEVSVGQHVAQGQIIGLSGCTGLCFGPHVHFEVRINGAVTNPVNYLG